MNSTFFVRQPSGTLAQLAPLNVNANIVRVPNFVTPVAIWPVYLSSFLVSVSFGVARRRRCVGRPSVIDGKTMELNSSF